MSWANAALRAIERLWDTAPGTPDGEDRGALITLVHGYEKGVLSFAAQHADAGD